VRKGQRTNQKYRNLVGSDQQMQKLENKLDLEKLTVEKWVILKKIESHKKKWVTLDIKNSSHLEKWVTLQKMSRTWKNT